MIEKDPFADRFLSIQKLKPCITDFGTVTIVGNMKAISYYVNITRLWVQRAHTSITMTSVVAF